MAEKRTNTEKAKFSRLSFFKPIIIIHEYRTEECDLQVDFRYWV